MKKRKRTPAGIRLWRRVTRTIREECWPWNGKVNRGGYGRLGLGGRCGRPILAHRLAWELTHGSVPDGLFVLHTCDNPRCCNPAHLWLGTRGDNNRDREAKGRGRRALGERNGKAKLSRTQVLEIRRRDKEDRGGLAAEYGVNRSTISHVIARRFWRHVA